MEVPLTSQEKVQTLWPVAYDQTVKLTYLPSGIANPVATILAAAMMLKYSFNMHEEAKAIESAIDKLLDSKDAGGFEIRTR